MLHLRGNLGQWIVAGIGGDDDTRNRPAEFSERNPIDKSALFDMLEEVVSRCNAIFETISPNELLRLRTIQGFEVSGAQAIFDSVAHFRGHTQEIVYITRQQLGEKYEFDFVPQTSEQGA